MKYDRPVTPAEISPAMRKLAADLCPETQPIYIDVRTVADAQPDECFPVVSAYTSKWGGNAITGWALWEFPGLFIEAEFHAVWRSPEGQFVDITPKRTATERILFLVDQTRIYSGQQVNNIRRTTSTDPRVAKYLEIFDEKYDILNHGERINQHGMVTLTGTEIDRMQRLEAEGYTLFLNLRADSPNIGPYSPCPCGSGKKVKWCHKQIANAA